MPMRSKTKPKSVTVITAVMHEKLRSPYGSDSKVHVYLGRKACVTLSKRIDATRADISNTGRSSTLGLVVA
uniref:Uncharacterized protein n=1 Tax=Romanomermis culicivorax TaxID=13658 RepID=A0A915IJM0_ROMCU